MKIGKNLVHFLQETLTQMGGAISPKGVGKKIAEVAEKAFFYLSHPPYFSRFTQKVFTHKHYEKPFTKDTIKRHGKEIEKLTEKVGQLLTIKESCLFLRTVEYWIKEQEHGDIPKEVKRFVNLLKEKKFLYANVNYETALHEMNAFINQINTLPRDKYGRVQKGLEYLSKSYLNKVLHPSSYVPSLERDKDVLRFSEEEGKKLSLLLSLPKKNITESEKKEMIDFVQDILTHTEKRKKWIQLAEKKRWEPFLVGDKVKNWNVLIQGKIPDKVRKKRRLLSFFCKQLEKWGDISTLQRHIEKDDLSLQEMNRLYKESSLFASLLDVAPPYPDTIPFYPLLHAKNGDSFHLFNQKPLGTLGFFGLWERLDSVVSHLTSYDRLLTEFELTHKRWHNWSAKERDQWKQFLSAFDFLESKIDDKELWTYLQNVDNPKVKELLSVYQRQKNMEGLSTIKDSLGTEISRKEDVELALKKAVFRPKYQRPFDHNSIKSEIDNIVNLHKKISEAITPYDKLLRPHEICLLLRSYVFWADNKETSPQELIDLISSLKLKETNWQQDSVLFKREVNELIQNFRDSPKSWLELLFRNKNSLIRKTFPSPLLFSRPRSEKDMIHLTKKEFISLQQLGKEKLDSQTSAELIPFLEKTFTNPSLAKKYQKLIYLPPGEPCIVENNIVDEVVPPILLFRCNHHVALAGLIEKHGGISRLTELLGTKALSIEEYSILHMVMKYNLNDLCLPEKAQTPLIKMIEKWKQRNYHQFTPDMEPFDIIYSHLSDFKTLVVKITKTKSLHSLTTTELAALQEIQEVIKLFSEDISTDIPQMQELQKFYQNIPSAMVTFIKEFNQKPSLLTKYLETKQPNDIPLALLEKKIQNIMDYAKKNKLHQLPSSQKLTFFELLIIRQKFYEGESLSPAFKKSFGEFSDLFLSYSSETFALVSAFSLKRYVKKQKLVGKKLPWQEKLLYQIGSLFEKYGHANIMAQVEEGDKRQFQISGLGDTYRKVTERSLTIDNFVVNTDALIETRHQNKFREKFQINWNKRVNASYPNLSLADISQKTWLRRYFGKKTKEPTSPEDISLSKYSELACIEFAVIALIETTIKTCKEMGLTPPDSLKFFGFRHREDLTSLTITRAIKTLQKKKILVPYLPFGHIMK